MPSGVALLITNTTFTRWLLAVATLAVLAGGVVVCLFLHQLINQYKDRVGLRMEELHKMEELLGLAGCHAMYHAEDRLYPRLSPSQTAQRASAFSDLERQLPRVFLVLYLVFAVGIAIGLVMGTL